MSKKKTTTEWELTRARFHIRDKFPPRDLREERNISDILPDIIENEVEKAPKLPEKIQSHWHLITGPQISKHTKPAYLRGKVLYAYADHPGWLTEVRRLPKNHLLKKLGSIQGLPNIQDIRFLLDPSIKTWKNRKQ